MASAAREAARRMAVAEMTVPQAQVYAQNYLAGWGLIFTVTATEPPVGVPNGDVSVQITVPAADAALVNFPVTWPGNLTALVTMRRES
jgi:hypothetical protein